MSAEMKLGVVLLAAGRSERFGANKLLADFNGRPMVCRALEAAKTLSCASAAVVTGNETIAQLAKAYGCGVIANRAPELGQAHSIHLGLMQMQDMDAVLLMVCDQPLLQGASLVLLVQSYLSSGKGIACLCDQTHMGNPAVFAARYYPELLALSGDCGAKRVLKAHADDLLIVRALGENELSDADTPQALEKIRIQ